MKSICVPVFLFAIFIAATAKAELAAEPVMKVASLPAKYPDTWVFAHDPNFDALIAGRVTILDVAADNREYKGALDASQFATFAASKYRDELYVAETFYSKGTRGVRTDLLTVYDKASLKPLAEIDLPGAKRGQVVSNKFAMRLVSKDRYLLLFNFAPAASVLVVNLESREIISEVEIPGCSMIYPTGDIGFSSLCGDGSMLSFELAEDGSVIETVRTPGFFDVDMDPLFDKPAYIGMTAYFPSFLGQMQPIDFSSSEPEILQPWSLVSESERKQNWRPSGWQIAASHGGGELYILMQKDGYNGSHKFGGEEVWVFDSATQKRVRRIELESPGFSIEVTQGDKPYLVVNNQSMDISVYTSEGEYVRSIGGAGAMPIALHAQH